MCGKEWKKVQEICVRSESLKSCSLQTELKEDNRYKGEGGESGGEEGEARPYFYYFVKTTEQWDLEMLNWKVSLALLAPNCAEELVLLKNEYWTIFFQIYKEKKGRIILLQIIKITPKDNWKL